MTQDVATRLRAALHPLHAPPLGVGWNLHELDDLVDRDALVPAAVLVGLVPRADGLRVLLTRRVDGLRQHGGQVSFPGGRVDPTDRDAIDAALRETEEEVGIPRALVEPWGYLDPLVTITGFRVVPVVAALDPSYVAVPDPSEVADAFEVDLAYLLAAQNRHARRLEHAGRARDVWEYRYAPQRIWGATASMLVNLADRMERSA
jgi:8-oxo-dGTP pyrophosphatase MutT (NUDIX family)